MLARQNVNRERLERAAEIAARDLDRELYEWRAALERIGQGRADDAEALPASVRAAIEEPGAGAVVFVGTEERRVWPRRQILYQVAQPPGRSAEGFLRDGRASDIFVTPAAPRLAGTAAYPRWTDSRLARWPMNAVAPPSIRLLEVAATRFHLTARACDRIRKVARTIADLEGVASIQSSHVAEALQYRPAG